MAKRCASFSWCMICERGGGWHGERYGNRNIKRDDGMAIGESIPESEER